MSLTNLWAASFSCDYCLVAGFAIGHVLSEGYRLSLALEKAKAPAFKEAAKTVVQTKSAYVKGKT